MKTEELTEKIHKILRINDATNSASWWNVADEIVKVIQDKEKEMGNKIIKNIESDTYHEIRSSKPGWDGDRFIHRGELLNYLNSLKGNNGK